MHKIDGAGHDNNQFVAEDPLNNVPGTLITEDWLNAIQEEMVNVILADGGGPLVKADNTQLISKIRSLIAGADYIARYTTTANVVLNGLAVQGGGDWATPLNAGDVVLVNHHATGSSIGLYAAAAGAWARAGALDTTAEMKPGLIVKVTEGATLADTLWMLATDAPIVLGTTALTFSRKDAATIPDATTAVKGKAALATSAEVQALADLLKIVTPGTLVSVLLGCGQTWQDVRASRAASTTYTNTTGKPIMVTLAQESHLSTTCTYTLNGMTLTWSHSGSATGITDSVSFIVPPNGTYSSNLLNTRWWELRT